MTETGNPGTERCRRGSIHSSWLKKAGSPFDRAAEGGGTPRGLNAMGLEFNIDYPSHAAGRELTPSSRRVRLDVGGSKCTSFRTSTQAPVAEAGSDLAAPDRDSRWLVLSGQGESALEPQLDE
jgi:hypothetical protein